MFKIVVLMRRKHGLSLEEFRRRYETRHAPLAAGLLIGLRRYVRNYVDASTAAFVWSPNAWDCDFDVMTEMWWDDEPSYRAAFRSPGVRAAIRDDEDDLFDLESIRYLRVEESHTTMDGSVLT